MLRNESSLMELLALRFLGWFRFKPYSNLLIIQPTLSNCIETMFALTIIQICTHIEVMETRVRSTPNALPNNGTYYVVANVLCNLK